MDSWLPSAHRDESIWSHNHFEVIGPQLDSATNVGILRVRVKKYSR